MKLFGGEIVKGGASMATIEIALKPKVFSPGRGFAQVKNIIEKENRAPSRQLT